MRRIRLRGSRVVGTIRREAGVEPQRREDAKGMRFTTEVRREVYCPSGSFLIVIPAKAGIQSLTRGSAGTTHVAADAALAWIPAFAGMTVLGDSLGAFLSASGPRW